MNDTAQLQELSFSVFGYVSRQPLEVYEAVADPEQLSRYFTTGGAQGRLETGATVTWDFHDFPGAFPVEVAEAEPPRRIVLRWDATGAAGADGKTRVTFDFGSVEGGSRTKVTITEAAWAPNVDGAAGAFGNCMGWTGMLAALKVWVEHRINLRDGFYQ